MCKTLVIIIALPLILFAAQWQSLNGPPGHHCIRMGHLCQPMGSNLNMLHHSFDMFFDFIVSLSHCCIVLHLLF